ncbi:hypothetical protein [Microbacterium sp. TNHR37B]|uniref:hypothetical protein n=1 Tax=Microbacterium sp. TNHR37B TaxID=1775956 RepID=UPI0007B178F7|nr:hypothetical protein [Microbacterium sp. TNHR37B]KZE90566.1 hypothetical protein AVP41_00085 [Microbacterium sp. TNHR37B]
MARSSRVARLVSGAAALGITLTMVGCGVVDDTLAGLTGAPASPSPLASDPGTTAQRSIVVTVEIDSDGSTAEDLAVEIRSPRNPQSLFEDAVSVPFRREFTVSTDAFFPLRATTVEVHAGPGATFVRCRILVDGVEVASRRSEGSRATATCERRLQLGPS